MRRDRMLKVGVATAFSVALVLKMILLEPVNLGVQGFSLMVVASLLPLALLLRIYGVPVIATACGLAHWLNHGGLAEALTAATAVGLATGAAYLVLHAKFTAFRWVKAGWIITAILATAMAVGSALFLGNSFQDVVLVVLSRTWMAINLVGVPLAIVVTRAGWQFSLSPDTQTKNVGEGHK